MKKLLTAIIALLLSVTLFSGVGCSNVETGAAPEGTGNHEEQIPPGEDENPDGEEELSEQLKANLSAGGYVDGKISDFSEYEGTDAYRKVTTADEFIQAIADAKYHYKAELAQDGEINYTPADGYDKAEGTVHVIEIANDLNLGYNVLSQAAKSSGIAVDYDSKKLVDVQLSEMYTENGISQIKVENTSNLLIYSKNGAKLTHCGFKLTSDTNVVFRNLEFDELWQWEDTSSSSKGAMGDYDVVGWAYFKIAFCGYIWIDHCTFGKSYDGQIDYSNPNYTSQGTAFRAPYGADGGNGLHISWCNFNAGSDDENGYLYQMMAKIEEDYQAGGKNNLYYNALRDGGATFEDILYGLAIPQKKGFLCGDNASETDADYTYNLGLQVSFANCKFTNLEDRIPKLRGGNAYMYNCIVDSSQYYGYRAALKNINGKTAEKLVQSVNSGWQCGLVSQGILCSNGGSVKAENCIFKGIENLLKNNDSKAKGEYVRGGYQLVNCSYQKGASDAVYVGSSSDSGNKFTNATTSSLKTDYFSWHTENGVQPFRISAISLNELAENLNNSQYGSGMLSTFVRSMLKSDYFKA